MLTEPHLLFGYLGDATTLDWYETAVKSLTPISVLRGNLDDDVAQRAAIWSSDAGPLSFRAAVPPANLTTFVGALTDLRWAADPAFGVVLGSMADEARRQLLRDAATSVGGTVRFGSSADDLDISTNPGERQIIERLKAAFDPNNRLQPLPWQRR
jgi:hypothetical protein